MRKVVGGFLAILLFFAVLLYGSKAYFFSIGYTQPLVTNDQGISYVAKVDGKQFYILDGEGQWKQSFLAGVDIGLGVPGAFPGELAIGYDTYFDWFTQIADLNSNVIRVYTTQSPAFYHALYEYNKVAATPLYLIQGIYMDESDVVKYGDVFAPGSITISDMRQDIIDCINMIHGNAIIGAKAGKASGIYQYDISKYVIGWILGIECEAYLINGTNKAHPDITSYDGKYLYTQNASPFEVFIAQMEDLAIAYETEQYRMQRPVAFCNWITADPLIHPNEPRETEDAVSIDVEHIKAKDNFSLGFFASYHAYPYYPDFLNFASGDAAVDADPYLAYIKSLVDYYSMPVLISEFGLPTSRGVTHINHLSGMNQGGNNEREQGKGLVLMLDDIYKAGCMGGIVFSWHDEWFKTAWNTMDFDDNSARPKWLDVETSEQNFGLLSFSAFPSILIDGDDSDWSQKDRLSEDSGLSAQWDESYLYLRIAVDDFGKQAYYIPIDTIAGEGSAVFSGTSFERDADFVLVLDGKDRTRLLIDPYYNANYKLYEDTVFSKEELLHFDTTGEGKFIKVQQVICNKMTMPLTGQTIDVQMWDTGKMQYGNANPDSAQYDSTADFCAGNGFVEIRIPWLLLNFADPSSGKILANLHTSESFAFTSIDSIYMGLGRANGSGTVFMPAFHLPAWGAFTYTQRLKQSYKILAQAFPKYATYPLNMGEQMQKALQLRDTRLLYVRIDRQIRSTDLVWYLLIFSLLLVVYLYILLLMVNLHLNAAYRKREREKARLRSLLKLPAADMEKALPIKYLCSAKGTDTLCQFLTSECTWESAATLIEVLRNSCYPKWMIKHIASRDLMQTILFIRMSGLLRLRYFEDQIMPLMREHKDNLDMQYTGFLALSMMGNRDTIVKLCAETGYTKSLSYRCLKEIFAVYTGDKRFLYSKLLHSKDAYIRRIIIKNIGDEGFSEFAGDLLPLMDIQDDNLRCDVIRTLGQLKCMEAGERIATFMSSGNWTLRNAIVVALAQIDAEQYRPQLMTGLCDREWWVRYNSARELCRNVPLAVLQAMVPNLGDRFAADILKYAIKETELMGNGVAIA